MISLPFPNSGPVQAFLCLIVISPLVVALRNIYFHPLARYPGPKLWVAFRFPYCFSLWKGTLVRDVQAIHKQYGSFVRVAPNEISVARTEGWNDVHCRRPGHLRFFKNPIWWEDFPGRTPSIVSTTSPSDHRRFRAVLSTCFTPSAIIAQEPAIISHVDKMIDQFRQQCASGDQGTTVINIVEWSKYIVFDILGDLGFAESFNCLEKSALHPWVAELYTYTKVGSLVAALRHYTILFKLIWQCIPAKDLEAARANFNWGVDKTHRRLNLEAQREDFISQIQQHNDNDDLALSLPELESNLNLLIQAGSDTCSIVLSGTINYLIKTPRTLNILVHEIRSSFRSTTEMTFANVEKLPYLAAVAKEGLRLCPPAPGGLNRLVPPGGDDVCDQWLPGGTHVSVHLQALHRSPEKFHDPDGFWPERWLANAKEDATLPFYNDDLEASQSFSTGTESCIGKLLAYAELHMILAKILWHFDMNAAPGGRNVEWLEQRTYAMVNLQPFDVQLTEVSGKLL